MERTLIFSCEILKRDEFLGYKFIELCVEEDHLERKLKDEEKDYNLHRPHSSHKVFTPYEVLKAKLENKPIDCQS